MWENFYIRSHECIYRKYNFILLNANYYDSSHQRFSSRIFYSSSGVKSFSILNNFRICYADFPRIMLATHAHVRSNKSFTFKKFAAMITSISTSCCRSLWFWNNLVNTYSLSQSQIRFSIVVFSGFSIGYARLRWWYSIYSTTNFKVLPVTFGIGMIASLPSWSSNISRNKPDIFAAYLPTFSSTGGWSLLCKMQNLLKSIPSCDVISSGIVNTIITQKLQGNKKRNSLVYWKFSSLSDICY